MGIFDFDRKPKSKGETKQNDRLVALYADSPADIQSIVTALAQRGKSILPALLQELDAVVPSSMYQTLDNRTFNALTGICLAL